MGERKSKSSETYVSKILSLVKQRLGIMSGVRDEYLTARVNATLRSLFFERGIIIDENDMNLTMFIVDFTAWQYENVGNKGMTNDLRLRLNNILVKYTRGKNKPEEGGSKGDGTFDPAPINAAIKMLRKDIKKLQAETIAIADIDTTTLKVVEGELAVNTTNNVLQDSAQPITSTGVHVIVGNIDTLLGAV